MPLSTTEIVLSNLKDVLGIAGTIMISVPFFRLERAKRLGAGLARPSTRNPFLLKRFRQAKENTQAEINEPSAPDFRFTLWGLLLLGISFLISFLLPHLG